MKIDQNGIFNNLYEFDHKFKIIFKPNNFVNILHLHQNAILSHCLL